MLKPEKMKQYGYPRKNGEKDIKGIVIHNTSNYEMSARQLFDYLNGECITSQGCTYLVDHNEIIQVVPNDFAVYSCGKGDDFSTKYLIAIEICSNLNNEKYLEGEQKAMRLVKRIMGQYGLTKNDIYFHQDFNNTIHCPNDILNIYGNRKNFINNYINEEE